MNREYTIGICKICHEQTSQAFTGEHHLLCQHAEKVASEEEKIIFITITMDVESGYVIMHACKRRFRSMG